ncbi:MAG: chemoreceptor glutamine deamidase CheD, partial [Alphaproteobacteria bacterium]|nr:chemoreceptor glutamine deamidase CheD [Alphaproteobacteria bacterium]
MLPQDLNKDENEVADGLGMRTHRFYDPVFRRMCVKVQPGTHYVTKSKGEMISTTLGSCIAVCIRDTVSGVGGMNHFMLPQSDTGKWSGANAEMRYGNHAMEVLLNDILKLGGARNRLEFKVFGGAHVINSSAAIGDKNIRFIEKFLRNEHMAVAAQHVVESQVGRHRHWRPRGN